MQYLLVCVGVLSVALGTAGIFLPLLPTTPFLLLAAACFLRSSKRLHSWLMTHKWFGPYIYNYCKYRAIPKKTKIISITLLWSTISYSALWIVPILAVKFLLFCIAIAVTWHLLSLNTLENIDIKTKEEDQILESISEEAGLCGLIDTIEKEVNYK
ncbi:MAG: YbaN family protein [Candidatus Omnitrophica bacterium]|nr:YbaN family protein [Candidatus Omnitrophota bacterium]MBU1997399.1 YbaN family protein [Candidatus Omnitrophota bacterium]MBU4333216.1 YbaN family protein [Candidatus Omnitrophota bacterium]